MFLSSLNKLCEIRDFGDKKRIAAIREMEPECVQTWPTYPAGQEQRKSWEYAQLITGLERLRAVNRDSLILAVAPATNPPQFVLTRRARLVFSAGPFAGGPAARMLTEPEALAQCEFERNRLIVQNMQPNDLRYEDETFDVVYSLGNRGDLTSIRAILSGMVRVCRNDGIVMLTVECAIGGTPPPGGPLTAREIHDLISFCPRLVLAQAYDWKEVADVFRYFRPLDRVVAGLDGSRKASLHIADEQQGCRFTSLSLFLRKGPVDG